MKLNTSIAAALVALMPMGANAFSLSSSNNIANGGVYDINGGPFFWDATFSQADGPGSVSFVFGNANVGTQTAGVTQGTVLQFSGQFDGLTVSWANGGSQYVAPGQNAIINISTILASGVSDTLTVSWGNVTGIKANIDLDIAAVPLPAGFLLLGTALVGAGAFVRRNRKA